MSTRDNKKNDGDTSGTADRKRHAGAFENKRAKRDGKRSNVKFNRNNDSDDGGGDGSPRDPHPGSYAIAQQRERFGIVVPDELGVAIVDPQLHRTEDEPPRVKRTKRKFALLFGYVGSGYGGFQMNEEQRTIQAEFELALVRSGLLLRSNFGHPWKYGWSVSGRTDKGVHAAGQVISCKLEVVAEETAGTNAEATTEDGIRNAINQQLPSHMQVLDVIRTTRNFCAKTQRHRVRYQYLVPSFMLHGDLQDLFRSAVVDLQSAVPMLCQESVTALQSQLSHYRASPQQLGALQGALSAYHGTHSFHNFTKGMPALEDRSKRFIESFDVGEPIVLFGLEWIPTSVVGQSFLLHQIRKMIGLALLVASEATPSRTEDVLKRALISADTVFVPKAPAQGLFLDMSVYETYNHRKNMTANHQIQDIPWGREDGYPARERYLAFRDRLLQHIGKQEIDEANFLQYLYHQHSTRLFTTHAAALTSDAAL